MAKKAKSKTKKTAAKKKTKARDGRSTRVAWSKQHMAALKRHSKSRTPVEDIAKEMGRSVGALRQQAFKAGLSLGHRR
jgi:hypothetical protein